MIKYALIAFSSVLLFACSSTKSISGEIQKVIFNSSTRGFVQEIEIGPDSTFVYIKNQLNASENRSIKRATTSDEWQKIKSSALDVLSNDGAKSISPSNDRATDAAAASRLVIQISSGDVEHFFDDKSPADTWIPLLKTVLNTSVDGEI